jgi:flagellar hook-associated protein 1 FlgK
MAISEIFNSSRQGLFASQGALRTISNNIANVNTPGYSRQVVSLESIKSSRVAGANDGASGNGVQIAGVNRQVDQLLERKLRVGMSETGRLEVRDRYLTLIENTFNDLADNGLSTSMDRFFNAVDDLSSNPASSTARAEMVSAAQVFASTSNRMYAAMGDLSMPVDQEITLLLKDINTRLGSLRDINRLIVRQESSSQSSLELRDQREAMLQELGERIDIQVLEDADGGVIVSTANGQLLLDREYAGNLERGGSSTGEHGFAGISINGRDFDFTGQIRGGTLKGLIEVRDQMINGRNGVLNQLNTLVTEFRDQVNSVATQATSRAMSTEMRGSFWVASTNVALSADTNLIQAGLTDRIGTGDVTFVVNNGAGGSLRSVQVPLDQSMSMTQIREAIEASMPELSAEIVDNRLVISSKDKSVKFAVAADSSGILVALGIGAMFTGTGASDIDVNPELIPESGGSYANVRTGRIDMSGASPRFNDIDNTAMLELSRLRTLKLSLFDSEATLTAHYAGMVGEVGAEQRQNQDMLLTQQTVQQFLADTRDSVSGVSLDEELTDMLRYQRSYQASGRMISVADELFKTILSMGM